MIKGCHKRIVFLKDTESELFDEAYFILKPCAISKNEDDIVSEATKIVSGFEPKGAKRKEIPATFISFLLGLGIGTLVMLVVHLILI